MSLAPIPLLIKHFLKSFHVCDSKTVPCSQSDEAIP
jgi:hypothetical protein